MSEILKASKLAVEGSIAGEGARIAFNQFNEIMEEDPELVALTLDTLTEEGKLPETAPREAESIVKITEDVLAMTNNGSKLGFDSERGWEVVWDDNGHVNAQHEYTKVTHEADRLAREINNRLAAIEKLTLASEVTDAALEAEKAELGELEGILLEHIPRQAEALSRIRGLYALRATAMEALRIANLEAIPETQEYTEAA